MAGLTELPTANVRKLPPPGATSWGEKLAVIPDGGVETERLTKLVKEPVPPTFSRAAAGAMLAHFHPAWVAPRP